MILLQNETCKAMDATYSLGILHFLHLNPGADLATITENLGISPIVGGMILGALAKQGKTFQVDGHYAVAGKDN